MPLIEAPPLLLAAEPPGTAFPARGWKRDFNPKSKIQNCNDALPSKDFAVSSEVTGWC